MTTACGLDFGTSNSAVGVIRDGRSTLARLEGDAAILPSAVFFDLDQRRPLFGAAAMAGYMSGADGRLMRALKSILSSSLVKESTLLGERRITFEAVIALFVGEMKRRAEADLGHSIDAVVHGRPVHFVDGDPAADRFAEDTLASIARQAGFRHIAFQYEPLAAARAYEAEIEQETLALICDLGGGTSDFSVVRLGPDRRERSERQDDILASHGIRLGGTDLDRLLSLQAVMPAFGLGSLLHNKNLSMPRGLYRDLADWPSINLLYTSATRRLVRELHRDAQEPEKLARLRAVVERQLGHRLALAVEEAKIALSDRDETVLAMEAVAPDFVLAVTRDDLEDAAADERARLAEAVRETLRQAATSPDEIGSVFLTGGSSRVPLLRKAIASVVDPARFASRDDLLSVALGLAEEARLRFA